MTQVTIAVDVDGTVADLYPELFRLYNKDYNDHVTVESAMPAYGHETWHIKKECGSKILDYFDLPTIYDNINPVPGALEGIQYLRDLHYRIVFNSSCFINRSDDKLKWLIKHKFIKGSDRLFKDWMVVADKSLINADIMIDDRPENIYNFKGLGIIFNQPYNQDALADARLKGWDDIIRVMSHLYPLLHEDVYV